MHAPKLSFPNSLNRFVATSKSFLRVNATRESKQATQAYNGSELLLSRYGLLIRAPAVAASICLDKTIGNDIHNMLITIRKGSNGSSCDALKSSSSPPPKIEPWAKILLQHLEKGKRVAQPPSPTSWPGMLVTVLALLPSRAKKGMEEI